MQILHYKLKYQKYLRLLGGFLLLSGQGAAVTSSDVTWCINQSSTLNEEAAITFSRMHNRVLGGCKP